MAIRWGNKGNGDIYLFSLFFWALKSLQIICSHEIKRHLLLGRKAMTNLDSILKSRDITLPTKVHIVKAMVFPVVMYGYESWTIKKAESWKTDAFKLVLNRILESPLDCKEIKAVNPKGNQLWIFTGRADAEAEASILWSPDSKSWPLEKILMLGKTEGKRSGRQRMSWLEGINDSMDVNLGKIWEMVKDWEAWRAAVHGIAKSQAGLRVWTTTN